MDQQQIKAYIRQELAAATGRLVPVGVSQRHVHLSEADAEVLFGKDYSFRVLKELSQPGQFAAEETVTVVGTKGCLHRVRVLGPCRSRTQVEISQSDCFVLGLQAPVRMSGDLDGTPGCVLIGQKGSLCLTSGVIVAQRHLHLSAGQAEGMGWQDGDQVRVRIGENSVVLERVRIRAGEGNQRELHIDIDEANAAHAVNGSFGVILGREDG